MSNDNSAKIQDNLKSSITSLNNSVFQFNNLNIKSNDNIVTTTYMSLLATTTSKKIL